MNDAACNGYGFGEYTMRAATFCADDADTTCDAAQASRKATATARWTARLAKGRPVVREFEFAWQRAAAGR